MRRSEKLLSELSWFRSFSNIPSYLGKNLLAQDSAKYFCDRSKVETIIYANLSR